MKANEIHVWNGRIVAGGDCFLRLHTFLSQDEVQRANAFRFEKDRRNHIICRGLLRSMLAGYLRLKPAEVQFEHGSEGKPFLQNRAVCFSVSHSNDRVLYAFCRDRELGVDLEQLHELPDLEIFAQYFFAPSEYAEFRDADPASRTSVFFCCWTRKEACMKGTGRGLAIPPDSFRVPAERVLPANARIMLGHDVEPREWSLRHLDPAPGYVGALATPLASVPVFEWTFENAEECIRQIDYLSKSDYGLRILSRIEPIAASRV